MDGWMDHMWSFWGMGWGMWFWILIIVGLSYIFYTSTIARTYAPSYEAPLEVARMRLARGEISLEEFERIRESLEDSR